MGISASGEVGSSGAVAVSRWEVRRLGFRRIAERAREALAAG